jgi:hypothetical protein
VKNSKRLEHEHKLMLFLFFKMTYKLRNPKPIKALRCMYLESYQYCHDCPNKEECNDETETI